MAEYINKDDTLEALMYEMCGTGYQSLAMRTVRFMPNQDVAPVIHGKWLEMDSFAPMLRCSVCGYSTPVIAGEDIKQPIYNYCMHCGAKMDVENYV